MSYIQEFLELHLPQFYLNTLNKRLHDPSFSDFNAEGNLFALTTDLLLFAQKGCGAKLQESLHALLVKEMLISYECLRHYGLPSCQSDSSIIRLMKKGIKEVDIQLLQLLLRLILCYIQSARSSFLNNTILTHISEISFIYPQVKTEISINFPEISLPAFFQKVLNNIVKNGISSTFIEVLDRIKQECSFMGNIEKVVDKIIDGYKTETESQIKRDMSSVDSQNDEQHSKENCSIFNDHDLLRKRKKKVFKEINKTKSDAENRTPIKQRIVIARYTPKTEKTEDQKQLEAKSPLKRTPIFKKIKKPMRKPLERTIYYGQTKKFVPKKSTSSNPQFILEKMLTASTLHNEPSLTNRYIDVNRKTQKKPNKFEAHDMQVNVFCIPETPRPNPDRKNNLVKKTQSMDFFRGNLQSFKS